MKWVDRIYIISLERHEERRNTIFADLKSAGFDTSKVQWIKAIDGNTLDMDILLENGTIHPTFKDPNGLLTKSIYGCAISHQLVYRNFLSIDDAETALILEDDAGLTHTGLRTLLPESDAYQKFIEEKNTFDWEVIFVGGASKIMPYHGIQSYVMKPMVRYPEGFAAHSYIINKSGAEKLIKSNQSIQFAADVNIHCSGAKIYCTPISYFSQKVGELDRWLTSEMHQNYVSKVLNSENTGGNDTLSSTTYGDVLGEVSKTDFTGGKGNSFKSMHVSRKVDVDYVDWKPFIAPNGDEIDGWTNIHLQIKNNGLDR
jgi:GR25 family glycosyltransferase involved in LPS biosynthesis